MSRWHDLISSVGGARFVSVLGGLFVLIGAVQIGLDVMMGGPLVEILLEFILLIAPGVVLIYGGYWIRQSDLHQDLYPRIAVWCLGGLTAMLGITALLSFNPDATLGHPLREAEFHMAAGSVSGLAVGAMEARALSRAAEAKEHEEALQESRDELQTLIELLPVAVFVAEADGQIVKWNDAAEEIWGGEIVESESVAEYDQYEAWWADTGEPVEPEEWPLARALQGEAVTDPDEIKIKRFDGERRMILSHGMPVRDATGDVSRAMVTLIDITERKERERELELFRTLLDHSTDSLLVVDPETGEYLDVNDTACRRRGYTREEFLELTVPDIETEIPDPAAWRSLVENLQAEESITFNGRHRRKDGSTYPVEVNATYIELDDEYVIALARDVTDRRQREQELERIERRFEAIFEDPNILVGLLEPDGTVLDINQTAMEYTDADLGEVTGKPFWETPWWGKGNEVQTDVREWVDRAAAGEYVEFETDLIRPDGQQYTLNGAFRPVTNDDGDVVSVIVSDRDVTERREYEQKLEESNERLEQFAYAASHDLQEPLRMVSSYLQLIDSRYADEFDEDGREFLEYAVDGADRMRDMIEGLLKYSRVDTRGDPFEPVDLNDVLADVRNDLQVKIAETDAEITSDELPRIEGDAGQLRQLFQNLLDNAIEYSGEGPPRVEISAERNGENWAISVSDNGIGIDPDEADRIFEVFQRLHASDEHPGTGIGLALCQRIVERHGGEIWVESDPGHGSTFNVTIPTGAKSMNQMLDRERSNA